MAAVSASSPFLLAAVALFFSALLPSSYRAHALRATTVRGGGDDVSDIFVDATSLRGTGDDDDDDPSSWRTTFHGIGAISGGATSRLLVDYPEPQRSEILDVLFKPNFAASLHILKVEIGGDSQSTDGTEPSHMHSANDLDCTRGYEWFLLKEAKKRNPDIVTYALPWEYPGWPNDDSGEENPFQKPELTVRYVLEWLKCARDVHGVAIDLLGLWNERGTAEQGEGAYVALLRKTLDDEGFASTKIVAKDGNFEVCDELASDPEYRNAVHAVGLHYPSDYHPRRLDACRDLHLPIWAVEESSSYADANGASCWARVLASHFVLSGITSGLMWSLVGSYAHGTNWYASALFRADQPWTGWYERDDDAPVVWATAHYTQFTRPGWRYLPAGSGSGELPGGGFYNSLVSTPGKEEEEEEEEEFTFVAVKISRDHASCTRPPLPDFDVRDERIELRMPSVLATGKPLHIWRSNFEAPGGKFFDYEGAARIEADGSIVLDIHVGDVVTLSTVDTARKGTFNTTVPASDAKFPLPHVDDFEKYEMGQEASYFYDQVGTWEIHPEDAAPDPYISDEPKPPATNSNHLVMRQMVPSRPIGGIGDGTNGLGPVSLVGMSEFNDLNVSARFRLPAGCSTDLVSACLGVRMHQYGDKGTVLCVAARGNWTLSYQGPTSTGGYPAGVEIVLSGTTAPRSVGLGVWHKLELVVDGSEASASLDGSALFSAVDVLDINSGFASIGTNLWEPVEFDDFRLSLAPASASAAQSQSQSQLPLQRQRQPRPRYPHLQFQTGQLLGTTPCERNGNVNPRQNFLMKSDWQLFHVPSGLCAEAGSSSSTAAGAAVVSSSVRLQPCARDDDDGSAPNQQFRNDYSKIRHKTVPVTLGAYKVLPRTLTLAGYLNGTVAVTPPEGGAGDEAADWNVWTVYPNTNQVRNVNFMNATLGYPSCLAVLNEEEEDVAVTKAVQ